jgi:hypothetical protein
MASRSPPPSKRGRRENDDDESRRPKKLKKGKEPTSKDADEEPLFDDTKFAVESAFRIHGLAEKLENLPVVKRAARRHFFFDDGGSDRDECNHGDDSSHCGDDGDDGSHDGDDGGTLTN